MRPLSERYTLWLLAAMQFAHIMDFMVLMPLSPQLMRVMHITQTQFAALVSSYTFAAALAGLAVARWCDAYSRKKLLLSMFAGFGLATLLCALSTNYSSLMLARCVAGLFGGVVGGIVQAYVADLLPPQRRGWGMGIIMTAFSLSAVAGVPFGIWLGAGWGWPTPFEFLALLSLVIGVVAWRYLPDPTPADPAPPTRFLTLLREPHHWYAFALTLALMMAGFTVIPYISPFLVQNLGFSETQLAWFYLAGGAATLFTAPVIGRMADRLGKLKTFLLVGGLSIIPITLFTHLQGGALLPSIAVMTLFMVLVSGRFIPAMALTSMVVAPRLRGRFMSLNVSVQQFGSGLAALVSGMMLGHDGAGRLLHYDRVGYVAVGATLLALLLAWRIDRLRVRSGVSH